MKLKILLLTCVQSLVCLLQVFLFRALKVSNSDREETAVGFMFTSLWHDISLLGSKFNVGTAPYFERKAHIFLPTLFKGTYTNSTLNFVLRIHYKAQSRNELLILVYNSGGTHMKPFPLPHSICFLQLAPRTVLHMNYPTGTPNTLEVDLPWSD